MFGCLIMLLNIINILGWIIWAVFSFGMGWGPGLAALIGCFGFLLSWGIVDGSIMSPAMYFFNPALGIWCIKTSFCNVVGLICLTVAAHFLY